MHANAMKALFAAWALTQVTSAQNQTPEVSARVNDMCNRLVIPKHAFQ